MSPFYVRPRRKVDETFMNYLKTGNPDPCVVRRMIREGANVNARDNYSNTSLHLVMRHCLNKLAVVSIILDAGANPNSVNVVRKTPLRMAIKYGQGLPVINELIKFGANINFIDRKGNSPLHFAVVHSRQPIIDAFLKLKVNVNVKNSDGHTVLHLCVICENLHTIRKILESKDLNAYINAQNQQGETPLMRAIKDGNYEIVKELLSFGASVSIPDKNGSSPLHSALNRLRVNLNIVGELVRYNADIYCYDTEKLSPLHLALGRCYEKSSDKLETVKTLLMYDALQNTDQTDWLKCNIGEKYSIMPEVLEFYRQCLAEVYKMKSELIHQNFSFLEFVIQGLKNKALFQKGTGYNTFTVNQILHICRRYAIYREIIASRLETGHLRFKLMDVCVYTKKQHENCKVILDADSTFMLSHYLSNIEMLNLIEAFSDFQAPCQDFGFLTLSPGKTEKRKHDDDG